MKRIFIKLAVLLPSLLLVSFSGVSYAATTCGAGDNTPKGQVLMGAGETGTDCTGKDVTNLSKTVVTILSIIVGVASVIMLVVAGLKYITSGGDSSKVASAKSTLVYALVGIFVAAIAQLLVHLALSAASSSV